jgi:hypothetical protein
VQGCGRDEKLDSDLPLLRSRHRRGRADSHEEKAKPLASFEEMAKEMERKKNLREQVFSQELGSVKDRERLLEEKFKEAMKRAEKDKDSGPYRNPLDYD